VIGILMKTKTKKKSAPLYRDRFTQCSDKNTDNVVENGAAIWRVENVKSSV